MFNNKKKEVNKSFSSDSSNRVLGFRLVTYILLLIIIATSMLLQSCEVESLNPQLDELKKQSQEELEKKINETIDNDNDEESQNDTTQDPLNPLFTIMDTSLIKGTIDVEQNFEDFSTIVYNLEVEGYMNISFIEILEKRGIRIETSEGSKSFFIEINQMKANIIGGEYDKFTIMVNGDYLYLFNDKGAYIFIS